MFVKENICVYVFVNVNFRRCINESIFKKNNKYFYDILKQNYFFFIKNSMDIL